MTEFFKGKALNSKYRIFEVNEPRRYASFKKEDGLYSSTDRDWQRKNTFNYEMIAPIYLSDGAIKQKIKDDLDFFFGLNGRLEYRTVPVLILRETKRSNLTKLLSERMVYALNAVPTIPLLMNEADLTEGEMLDLSNIEITISSLNEILMQYGLELIEEEREIEMFVLTERGYQKPNTKLEISRYGYVYPGTNQEL